MRDGDRIPSEERHTVVALPGTCVDLPEDVASNLAERGVAIEPRTLEDPYWIHPDAAQLVREHNVPLSALPGIGTGPTPLELLDRPDITGAEALARPWQEALDALAAESERQITHTDVADLLARGLEEVLPDMTAGAEALIGEHGLDPDDITGTGKAGRITKSDVDAHLEALAEAEVGGAE